jgi:hypothetical protein
MKIKFAVYYSSNLALVDFRRIRSFETYEDAERFIFEHENKENFIRCNFEIRKIYLIGD